MMVRTLSPARLGHVLVLASCGVDVSVAGDTGMPPVETSTTADVADDASSDGAASSGSSSGAASTGVDESSSGDAPKLDVAADTDDMVDPTGCASDIDAILVLSADENNERRGVVHRFDPTMPELEWYADAECLELDVGDTPSSFAVGRDGRGYLGYVLQDMFGAQTIWTINLAVPDPCTTLEQIPWSDTGGQHSLAFVALDPEQPELERLFVQHGQPAGCCSDAAGWLGWADLDTEGLPITELGATPAAFMTIAGTADGRLYGLGGEMEFVDDAMLVELDPQTGAAQQLLTTMPSGHIGFFGGDLVVFDPNQLDVGQWAPRVLHYDLDDNDGSGAHELTEIYGEADAPPNIWIRGVASSTCIPVDPAG